MLFGNEEIKLDLFSDDVIFYVENLTESTKKFSNFYKVSLARL